jgi:hypothetical protein
MTAEQAWTEEAVDAAGGLDVLLTDAALGLTRRLRPDSSLLRLAAGLARRPGFVARQAAQFGSELGQIAAGRSATAGFPIRPGRTIPSCGAPSRPTWPRPRPPRTWWPGPNWAGATTRG